MLSCLNDVITMRDTAVEQSRQRATRLKEALEIAERFQGDINEILAEMNRIRDLAIRSHEIPVISADIVRQQLKDLQVSRSHISANIVRLLLKDFHVNRSLINTKIVRLQLKDLPVNRSLLSANIVRRQLKDLQVNRSLISANIVRLQLRHISHDPCLMPWVIIVF